MSVAFTFVPHDSTPRPGASESFFFQPSAARSAMASAADAGFRDILIDDTAGLLGNIDLANLLARYQVPLGVVLTHWAGSIGPRVAATTLADLAERLHGPLSLRIVDDSDDAEDEHTATWRRTDEYLTLLRQLWLNPAPIDHEGRFYRLRAARMDRIGPAPAIGIRMNGLSGTALQVAGRHADVFELHAASLDETRLVVERVRAAAARHGRGRKIRFALPIHLSGRSATASAGRDPAALSAYIDAGVSEFMVTGLDTAETVARFAAWSAPLRHDRQRAQTAQPSCLHAVSSHLF